MYLIYYIKTFNETLNGRENNVIIYW
jgi:hypothetical protein